MGGRRAGEETSGLRHFVSFWSMAQSIGKQGKWGGGKLTEINFSYKRNGN